MPEKHLPFMLPPMVGLLAGIPPVPGAKVNITRIIEAIVIAVLCAGATAYITLKTLETKFTQYEVMRVEDRTLAARDRAEIKQEIAEVKDLVMDHIIQGVRKGK